MAGYGLPPPAHQLPPHPPSSTHALPTGPCGYKDCGCEQFWDKRSADCINKEDRASSERSTWCVCEHHACFHKRSPTVAPARAPAPCDGRCRVPGSQCEIHGSFRARRDNLVLEGSQTSYTTHWKASRTTASQRLRDVASHANGTAAGEQAQGAFSEPSTSGLPPVPSICLLSQDRNPATNRDGRAGVEQSRQTIAGLGLSMMDLETTGNPANQPQSVTSTVPDDFDFEKLFNASASERDLPATQANCATVEHVSLVSPVRGPLDAIREYNRTLHVDVSGDTVPETFNPGELIQSTTEVATPSNANTPNLAEADRDVREGRQFIEALMQQTANVNRRNSADVRPSSATSAPGQHLLLTNSPDLGQAHLQRIIKSSSPQALQKIVSYLRPLHNLLNSMPNVANTMEELSGRLALLENNNSFNHVNSDDLQQHLEMFDGRMTDLETRMDEHDILHRAIEQDDSSVSHGRRRIANVNASFGSNCSVDSATSSALILAAMDRKDVETSIDGIKDRLDVLEAAAMPTSLNPWEVEVVLLPWGRDLRGIWFARDESMHDPSKATTQDSEEWTQARSSTLGQPPPALRYLRDTDSSPAPTTSRSPHPFSDTESGWSSQAISDWASGTEDDLLLPKACGSNNLVYKRLRSRGFIKDVTITSASSKDIQATLSRAFDDLLEHVRYTDEDEHPTINSYPGLKASFVPLRKVIKDSRLRFLTPAEMVNSALWSAHFLTSGVLMRVSGGRKRLYVTQREAYIQAKDQMGSSWTWQELRQLPRQQIDPNSQMEGSEEHCQPREVEVAEADAREACWSFYAAYDAPPPSANTSFGSHQSVELELSMRPAHSSWRRSMTPTSILKNRQPISPLSEFHPQRPGYPRNRTVSASLIEPATSGSTKRRLNLSPVKQSSAPQVASRAPSVSITRPKRRRVTNSSSPHPNSQLDVQAPMGHVPIWTAGRCDRSREPPSPFFSSEAPQMPPIPRTNSDLASRPSQRSVAVVGKGTPFAYATPHSGVFVAGNGFGGGDTEADDDDAYQDDDGELSWRGVVTGEERSESSSSSEDEEGDVEAGAQEEPASFSGDEDVFGTEADDDYSEEEDGFGAQKHKPRDDVDDSDEEGESGSEIFDTLLNVLRD
jgi:hypothetical protein